MRAAAGAAGLRVVTSLPVIPRDGKAALFAVHVLRRGAGTASTRPPLVVRDAHGARTPGFVRLRAAMGMPP